MMQSTFSSQPTPAHVAIIMDGNGRWAAARAWPRARGHLAGIAAVRRVVEAAPRLGIATLTLYVFSADNWRRPAPEVHAIFELLRAYLESERGPLARAGVRCSLIGRRDRLSAALLDAVAAAESATRAGDRLWLRLAVDYSGRDDIARAAAAAASRWAPNVAPNRDLMARLIASSLEREPGPVDLLIRTGAERRLSDFLLWECAYAELLFTRTLWPDFGRPHLRRALAAFARRQRRFGALPEAASEQTA